MWFVTGGLNAALVWFDVAFVSHLKMKANDREWNRSMQACVCDRRSELTVVPGSENPHCRCSLCVPGVSLLRSAHRKQTKPSTLLWGFVFFCFFAGKRDPDEGVQRAGGAMSGHGVRRRARPVPRPHGAVQDRRQISRHKLPVHGRLRGPRLLLGGNGHSAGSAQGEESPHEASFMASWLQRGVGGERESWMWSCFVQIASPPLGLGDRTGRGATSIHFSTSFGEQVDNLKVNRITWDKTNGHCSAINIQAPNATASAHFGWTTGYCFWFIKQRVKLVSESRTLECKFTH